MANYTVNLTNDQDKYPVDEAKFQQNCIKMLRYIINNPEIIALSKLSEYNLKETELNFDVLISDDERIQELNKEYREQNKPTDVLSFALFADNPESRIIIDNNIYLGEIIISAETAKVQADENQKDLEHEINFLLSHGLLHLFGFDHHDEASLEFMLKIQTEMILNS